MNAGMGVGRLEDRKEVSTQMGVGRLEGRWEVKAGMGVGWLEGRWEVNAWMGVGWLEGRLHLRCINVMHPEFMTEEFSAQDFKDSPVIADDVDVFPSRIKKKVMTIANSVLQIGRHFNVSLCFTTHSLTNGAETKMLLSEAHIITVFAKTTGSRALRGLTPCSGPSYRV